MAEILFDLCPLLSVVRHLLRMCKIADGTHQIARQFLQNATDVERTRVRWLELKRLCKVLLCPRGISCEAARQGAIAPTSGFLRVQLDSLVEISDRAVECPLLPIDEATAEVGESILRIERECLGEIPQRSCIVV